MRPSASFLLLPLFLLSLCSAELSPFQNATMAALAALLRPTSSSWNTIAPDPCSWRGVTCDGSFVTGLSLPGILSVPGGSQFFSYLCQLGSLRSLDLSSNAIASIPGEFLYSCTGLDALASLNLSKNALRGALPDFSRLPGLMELNLSRNSLTGTIGSQLDGLSQLMSLDLSYNSFSGAVPTRLGKAMALERLLLSHNSFNNTIPQELFVYGNLTFLDLSANFLSGSVPVSIGTLSKLENLFLSANHLIGELPGGLVDMPALVRFAANKNNFSGSIPQLNSRNLMVLDLSTNQLSGFIPEGLLSLPSLESVDLTYNQLRGQIPDKFSRKLFRLRLSGNSLNGSIPISIGELLKLIYFEMDENKLTGKIPLELGNCTKLQLLNLGKNNLEGPVPEVLGSLHELVILKLDINRLDGQIPNELSQLSRLSTLNLSFNQITGAIPPTIFGISKLSFVNLNGNELNGAIPDGIGNTNGLLELQLGDNKLGGEIPRLPSSLQVALNLSGNNFSGPIPSTLSGLQNLEILDLSDNQFTGNVPQFLSMLLSLTQLDISNNQLSGTLPIFPSFVNVTMFGNANLLPSTLPTRTSPRKKFSVVLMVVVAICTASVVIGLVAVGFLFISRRFYRVDDENLPSQEQRPEVILSSHILTADAIHRSSLDFNKALEAVNIPANLFLKSRFAAYYKAIMPSGKSYCVKKLNWGDKLVQLGNNEKFAEVMEVLGRITNSRIMAPLAYALTSDNAFLFYEYAHKGTLFDILHSSSGDPLDWSSRYAIALGAAQGLFFLHEFKEPIILLDLSSKSILLKSATEPQIADIELYRVIDTSKSTGSFSRVAGSVGYTPPEYAYTMRVTRAGNVYSFGVVLLELLTGKPPVCEGIELAKWVASKSTQNGGVWDDILDSRISSASVAVQNQMLSVLKVAQICVNASPDARPKMKNAVQMLLNAR